MHKAKQVSIWAISDLHFPSSRKYSMDRYGTDWKSHTTHIIDSWQKLVKSEDFVLLGGDISWGFTFEQAKTDLDRIYTLPGKKIFVKGNHDCWLTKPELISTLWKGNFIFLQGGACLIDKAIICGTQGWLSPNDPCFDPLDDKTFNNEIKMLIQALEKAKQLSLQLNNTVNIYVLLHFPPFTTKGIKTAFWDIICDYKKEIPISTCIYGHFHLSDEWNKLKAIEKQSKEQDGIDCFLTVTSYLKHTLHKIA